MPEPTVNQVIRKRMVKQQPVRWSPEGAHLLLHVRTQVINDDQRRNVRRWSPGFDQPVEPAVMVVEPPPDSHGLEIRRDGKVRSLTSSRSMSTA